VSIEVDVSRDRRPVPQQVNQQVNRMPVAVGRSAVQRSILRERSQGPALAPRPGKDAVALLSGEIRLGQGFQGSLEAAPLKTVGR
jgi:hypothetical protein